MIMFLCASRLPSDSGSQKVQHRFGGFKHKVRLISMTKRGASKNSSDLERAPGARSIAAEFFEAPLLVIELQRCEDKPFHFHVAPFGIRTLLYSRWRGMERAGEASMCVGGCDPKKDIYFLQVHRRQYLAQQTLCQMHACDCNMHACDCNTVCMHVTATPYTVYPAYTWRLVS